MELPTIPPIVNLMAVILAGGFTIYSAFFNKQKEIVKEADEMDNKLITLLKETVNALEKRVAELEKKLTETLVNLTRLQSEKDSLQAEKNVLAAVLQGRDAQGSEVMKQSVEAMQNIRIILELAKETKELVTKLQKP